MTAQDQYLEEKLKNMDVLDKANELESLIAKSELNTEFCIKVAWQGDRQETINSAKALIQNARELFTEKRIGALDYDVRQATYLRYHGQFNSYLKIFPEYQVTEAQTENVNKVHSM